MAWNRERGTMLPSPWMPRQLKPGKGQEERKEGEEGRKEGRKGGREGGKKRGRGSKEEKLQQWAGWGWGGVGTGDLCLKNHCKGYQLKPRQGL